MNSGSSLNCLDGDTLVGTKNSSTGREMYQDISPFGRQSIHSVSSFLENSLSGSSPRGTTVCSDTRGQWPVSSEDPVQFLCFPGSEEGLVPKNGVWGVEPWGRCRAIRILGAVFTA
jgi:hypothetical protein